MNDKCQLKVTVTHPNAGAQSALDALELCLDDNRFWDELKPAFQEAFRKTVSDFTGESHRYVVNVKENELLRHFRQKTARYDGTQLTTGGWE